VVEDSRVTADTHISVSLASDPGPRQLSWVERDPGSGFTVHMSGPTKKAPETSVTYVLVEPTP
jgi:hypothetical protein